MFNKELLVVVVVVVELQQQDFKPAYSLLAAANKMSKWKSRDNVIVIALFGFSLAGNVNAQHTRARYNNASCSNHVMTVVPVIGCVDVMQWTSRICVAGGRQQCRIISR